MARAEAAARTGGRPRRTPWLAGRTGAPAGPAGDLFCFPHAGGSPGEYVRWSDGLPSVRVLGVQPPGRATRLFERPYARMDALVGAVLAAVPFEPPFAFFGHSLGALVAFEVARALRAAGAPGPSRLIVSGCPPPPDAVTGPPLHLLPGLDLLAEIERRWGPFPAEVRADPELLAARLTGFRADLELLETYRYAGGAPLGCPVTAIGGSEDRGTAAMDGWRRHTRAAFDRHVLPGGHFYLRERRPDVLRLVHGSITGTGGAPDGPPAEGDGWNASE